MNSELEELYQEIIIDHYKNPRCQGSVARPDANCDLRNPLCGDVISLTLQLEGEQLIDIAFIGKGCSISQASASLMAELCKGRRRDEVKALSESFCEMIQGTISKEAELKQLGDAEALKGVSKFPARYRCALLAWEALGKCLDHFEKDQA